MEILIGIMLKSIHEFGEFDFLIVSSLLIHQDCVSVHLFSS